MGLKSQGATSTNLKPFVMFLLCAIPDIQLVLVLFHLLSLNKANFTRHNPFSTDIFHQFHSSFTFRYFAPNLFTLYFSLSTPVPQLNKPSNFSIPPFVLLFNRVLQDVQAIRAKLYLPDFGIKPH